MRDCTTSAYGGCNCLPGHCQSVSRRLDDINRKIKLAEAKRRADRALLTFVTALSIGAWVLSFIFIAIPESQRLDRVNQEQVHVVRR